MDASPLDAQRQLYALKRAPALRHGSNTALLRLLELGVEATWAEGAVLCEEGQDARGFFLLLEGELEVRSGGEVLLTLRPGTPFGVEALLEGRSSATLTAVTASRGRFFPRETVEGLVHALAGARGERHSRTGAPSRQEAPRPPVEVVSFESEVRAAPLSTLIALVAKVIAQDFGDRVLLVRTEPRGARDSLVQEGADGVLRATLPEPSPGAPGRVDAAVLRRLARGHGAGYVFLDGCCTPDAAPDRTVRLMPGPPGAGGPLPAGQRVLPTVVVDPRRPPRGSALGGRPQRSEAARNGGVPPTCVLRLAMEPLALLPVDDRPLEAVKLGATERDALARWARALTGRRVGLALGGGGVWGFYHVHLLRRLVGQGVPVDFISGSSMGSLVGAYFCGTALDGGSGLEGLLRLEERAMSGELSRATLAAVVTTYSLERFVEKDLGGLCLEELPTRFLPVATDLAAGDCVALERGPVALGVRASGSAPGIWAPTLVPPSRYVDGAFTSMVPARALLNAGADLVFASNVFPFRRREEARAPGTWLGRFLSGLDPVARARDLAASGVLLMHRSGELEGGLADVRFDIQPDEAPLRRAMEFTRARYILGRAAADALLEKKLEALKAHWMRVKARGQRGAPPAGGRQAA